MSHGSELLPSSRQDTGPVAPALNVFPIHLGRNGSASSQPAFTGGDWYEGYSVRTAPDGTDGRLVSQHVFNADWTVWEMHPAGDEVVLCLSGAMTLILERVDGTRYEQDLTAGAYALVPAGVWHTANIRNTAVHPVIADNADAPHGQFCKTHALFITPGLNTCHRPH